MLSARWHIILIPFLSQVRPVCPQKTFWWENLKIFTNALILGINGAYRGIELTNITINRHIVTFKMRDTKTKTAKSFVIRDEIMNIFKNNSKYIVLAANTIITAKSREDLHDASSASHQQHQSPYTDQQPGSRDPPVYIKHCSPDEKIKIDTHPKSSSTRSLPCDIYHYYIIIILLLSTTIIHCSQIGDWPLGGSNSQPLLPAQREVRTSELSTSVTASSQPGSISNKQQTNIHGPREKRAVTITTSPNMSNVNFPSNDAPGGTRTITITTSPNMSNVDFQINDQPGGTITVTITSCPNMSNVKFIFNARPGSTITATLTNCPNMSKVTFIFNAAPGRTITVTLTDRPNMSNAEYIYN
ncbi:uncharacterized protein LOC133528650 [Cydia pomonella]|uniref:uncharacterized protein LOC133528650 n=1 Tax=Cydia pomonella TaxID=82600 RepID=UPI002ADDC3C8|nr:uncharacterized protein LOC133528650 [Cydia pomonella]